MDPQHHQFHYTDDSNYTPKPKSSRLRKFSFKYIFFAVSFWLVLVNYYERTVVKRAMKVCQWNKWETWPSGADPHRISLFADPQIMDAYSYPDRAAFVNYFTRLLLDNYHKRNWNFVQTYLDPDSTFFLGDLFDGGRNWGNEYWFNEYRRFNSIYDKKPNKKIIMSVPGNHDIGFGNSVDTPSLKRFETFFGESCAVHYLGNHTIVLLDTISLSDYDTPENTQKPKALMEKLGSYEDSNPRILLSHVPLYRDPAKQTCGPMRESSKKFPIMKGLQFQTVIEHDLTNEILKKVNPVLAFSGDDHDYCHVKHAYLNSNNEQSLTDEITVKSCSMNMGIKRPAIQLLSLYNPDHKRDSTTYQTNICYLPEPYKALKMYIIGAILNLIWFIIVFLRPSWWNKIISLVDTSALQLPTTSTFKKPVNLHTDYLGFVLNGAVVIVSVLLIFTIYFQAF